MRALMFWSIYNFCNFSQQTAIIDDLKKDIPLEYSFLFTENHAEVISGKQEGVYAWISINFMLGKFEHMIGGKQHSILFHVK